MSLYTKNGQLVDKPDRRCRQQELAIKTAINVYQRVTDFPTSKPSTEGDEERPKSIDADNDQLNSSIRAGGKNLQVLGDVVMEDLDSDF